MTPINARVIIIISNKKEVITMNKINLSRSEKIKMLTGDILVISIDKENISYRFSNKFNRLKVELVTEYETKEVSIEDAIDNIRLKIDDAFMALDDGFYQGDEITDTLIQYICNSLRMELLGYDAFIKSNC